MRAKYGDPIYILANPIFIRVSYSHTWICALKVLDEVKLYIGVCFQSGNSSFWWENWTNVGKLKDHA